MRALLSFVFALGCSLALAAPAVAQTPTVGASWRYPAGSTLSYRFGGLAYPPAIQSAIQIGLTSDWSNATYNNSRIARFAYSAAGAGQVIYSSSSTSPCGTGHTDWLQCASNWGSTAFRIYIRNFTTAPYASWTWCNVSLSGTCWDVERALMHEALHVTMGAGHDPQGESNTVMGAVSPWYPNIGWNTRHIQRCDEAAAQLIYGLQSSAGPLADCFGSIAGHGSVGLIPALTASTTTFSVCASQAAVLSGRFAIGQGSGYGVLSGQALSGRTVWFDRKPHASSTWTLNVASATTSSGSWSRSFITTSTATITYDFRPHTSAEAGLDPATGPVIVVTWRAGC